MHLILLSALLLIRQDQVHGRRPLPGIKSYEVVYPRKVHTQYKRETGGIHPDIVHYELPVGGRRMVMQLQKTEDLIADDYTETFYLPNGEVMTSRVPVKDHCYYQGHIKQENDSLVSISTCDGLSGYIKISDQVYLIEPLQDTDTNEHAVYRHEDLEHGPKACAVPSSATSAQIMLEAFQPENTGDLLNRMKYIELYVVADHSMYKKYNSSQQTLKKRILQIVNHANLLYKPLNIFLALVGSEIWTTRDLITMSPDIEMALTSFSHWISKDLLLRKTYDDAFLITDVDFDGQAIGLAYVGGMCLHQQSSAVIQDHSKDATEVGAAMAHEMGHNLGMRHDGETCSCKSQHCIMSTSTSRDHTPNEFSSCSLQYFKNFISNRGSMCIWNKPSDTDIGTTSGCGNMILQDGEECDCGSPEECNDPCCNAKTCTLKPGAKCSSGECCENCQFKKTGIVCRPAKDECDLTDVCDGQFAQCPADNYRLNGSPCKDNQGYCYMGKCPTLQDQCTSLMGQNAESAPVNCFSFNTFGNFNGYCKKDGDKYLPCEMKDILCGKLFCQERGQFFSCLSSSGDEWEVANGTKCGNELMCLNGECKNMYNNWIYCSEKCKGHAVCNHELHCQCEEGWAPPNCDVLLFPKIEP